MYILPFTLLDHFLRFPVYTNFCIVEKILNLLYPFSGVHLGTRPLKSRGKFKNCPSIY